MQNSISVKRAVYIFLLPHTAIILMLAFLLKRNEPLDTNPALLFAGIALAVAITIYTAYRITESINEKIQDRVKKMVQYAEYLQTRTRDLDNYAVELKQWASDMNKQQVVLAQRVRMINEYGNKMNELAGMMNAPKNVSVKLTGNAQ